MIPWCASTVIAPLIAGILSSQQGWSQATDFEQVACDQAQMVFAVQPLAAPPYGQAWFDSRGNPTGNIDLAESILPHRGYTPQQFSQLIYTVNHEVGHVLYARADHWGTGVMRSEPEPPAWPTQEEIAGAHLAIVARIQTQPAGAA